MEFLKTLQVGEKSFDNLQILQIYALIKSPKQRWETYCFCSISYYYYYYKCGHRNVLSKRQVWLSIFHII